MKGKAVFNASNWDMLLISKVSLSKSSPVWERWEGGGCIYNSQCLELLVLTCWSASSTDNMRVWGIEIGCRRKSQKSSSPWDPASRNKLVLCKLALFNPKWGTDKSSEGNKELCWPPCREGTQRLHQDFFSGLFLCPRCGLAPGFLQEIPFVSGHPPSLLGSSCSTQQFFQSTWVADSPWPAQRSTQPLPEHIWVKTETVSLVWMPAFHLETLEQEELKVPAPWSSSVLGIW